MLKNPDHITARNLLMDAVRVMGTEEVPLWESGGRILAQELIASENIPPFDRSPYDGYALRASDTANTSRETPVMLRVLEEVPAGAVPTNPVRKRTAIKLSTGAPLPQGADTVIPFEHTDFTEDTVTIFSPMRAGENIIRAGEDVRKG